MAKPNDPLKAVKDFLKEVEEDEYLVPGLGQEQREETLFKEQILDPAFGERERDTNDGCVGPWDMNRRWPMNEESDEEYKLKAQAFGSMACVTEWNSPRTGRSWCAGRTRREPPRLMTQLI